MVKKLRTYIKKKWLPTLIAYSAKYSIRLILRSCQVEISGLENLTNTATESPCILALWHNRLALVSEILYQSAPCFIYTAFISKSLDGEPLAKLAQSYRAGRALRVPHNLRHHALSQMIHHLKDKREILLITPDGPRGPCYEAKPGIVTAALAAEAKVVPFSWHADRFWKLKTWDQMMFPKPFSKIKVAFGVPLNFKKEETKKSLLALEQALMCLEKIKGR